MMSFRKRLERLRGAMCETGLDGFVVLDRANTFYFTGFRGSDSIVIVMRDAAIFLADSRYFEGVKNTLPADFEVVLQKRDGKRQIKDFFAKRRKLRIGFEPSIPYAKHRWLRGAVRPAHLTEAGKVVSHLRLVKDGEEIRHIRSAASIADRCLKTTFKEICPGLTEHDIAIRIRRFFEDAGAEGESFPTIVASGSNAAIPHHQTSRRKLRRGDVVLIDLGCKVKGYCSDMTRTVFVGETNKTEREIYKIVLEAQRRGIAAVKPGIPAKRVDREVRNFIAQAGFGDAFGHGTGHGVGIEVHEPPVISPRSKDILKEGMVITVEPGIYLRGKTGVRIEDLILVTKDGARRLSKFPRRLSII